MREYAIAAIPVDGIGRDVIAAGLEVLQELAQKPGPFHLKVELFPWGSDNYKQHGAMMPKDGLERLQPFSAIYFGAIDAPASAKLRNLLAHKDLGTAQNSDSAEVPTHGTVLVKVSK
jgi:isocitrate/isopropylmalate dehydrogenase